jgi:streptogramin lyase
MVGRLVPRTGEAQLAAVPTLHANPYGMVVNSKGVPFFAEFGSNKLASINPNALEIREYVLPHAESRRLKPDLRICHHALSEWKPALAHIISAASSSALATTPG